MKRITKGSEPESLSAWKSDNVTVPQNLRYGAIPTQVKSAIKHQMLREQGFLCAYTMIRLPDSGGCHIEHVEPQSQSRARGDYQKEIDYENMLSCFPPGRTYKNYPFGACRKGGTYVSSINFVWPTSLDIENKFKYRYDGSVIAENDDPTAASTIQILGLNHPQIRDMRRAAIEAAGISRFSDAPLSAVDARELSRAFLDLDSDGRLPEFCFAVSQVALQYAEQEEVSAASDNPI